MQLLIFAVVVIFIAAIFFAVFPTFDPALKRLLIIIVSVIVAFALLAFLFQVLGGSGHPVRFPWR